MRIVVLGLSITSSWGNGHATTYRALLRALGERGHSVLFLERDKPWYRENRDVPALRHVRIALYESLDELDRVHAESVRDADLVIVGSYVPDGVKVAEWVHCTAQGITAFYDIDTPVTLAKLERGDFEYLVPGAIAKFGMYLSFTGGPTLRRIERDFGSRMARALHCSVDPELYYPEPRAPEWLLGYLGTYSADRQPALERLLIAPARKLPLKRFVVAGPLYPNEISWPSNVSRIEHLPPAEHRSFYNAQRFTLNITRADMVKAGHSPSVRLFEAAACAIPIISDWWVGLDEIFTPGKEVVIAKSASEAVRLLGRLTESQRIAIGRRARDRILAEHTSSHRARQVEEYVREYNALGRCERPAAAGFALYQQSGAGGL
jgi:spore maturation protein CgeB